VEVVLRRVALEMRLGSFEMCCRLFEASVEESPDPRVKLFLLRRYARFLEDVLGQPEVALRVLDVGWTNGWQDERLLVEISALSLRNARGRPSRALPEQASEKSSVDVVGKHMLGQSINGEPTQLCGEVQETMQVKNSHYEDVQRLESECDKHEGNDPPREGRSSLFHGVHGGGAIELENGYQRNIDQEAVTEALMQGVARWEETLDQACESSPSGATAIMWHCYIDFLLFHGAPLKLLREVQGKARAPKGNGSPSLSLDVAKRRADSTLEEPARKISRNN